MSPSSSTVSLLSQHLITLLDLTESQWRRTSWSTADIAQDVRDVLSACGIATLGDLTTIGPLALLALAAVPRPPDALPDALPDISPDMANAAFWPTMQRAARERVMPVVERLVVDLIVTQVACAPQHAQGARTASTAPRQQEREGSVPPAAASLLLSQTESGNAAPTATENSYSSLFADAQVIFDAAQYAQPERARAKEWADSPFGDLLRNLAAGFESLMLRGSQPELRDHYYHGPTELRTAAGTFVVPMTGRDLAATPLLSRDMRAALHDLGCDLQEVALDSLDITVRTGNCCHRAGIHTLEALARQTPSDLLDIRNVGVKSFQEVHNSLRRYLAPWLDRIPLDVLVPGGALVQDTPASLAGQAAKNAEGGEA